jgi:hypothetical protein
MTTWPARIALVAALAAPLLAIPGTADAAPRKYPRCVTSVYQAPGRAWISARPVAPLRKRPCRVLRPHVWTVTR